ncbi:MAG: FHA domain-containing protein [Verrucomicrobiae bacterium]|nr:FHA domain-containing protein [Verrucomicrobiae bacterium]
MDPRTEVTDGGWFAAASFLSLPELIQTIALGRKTGQLAVTNGRCTGALWFRDGEIQRARCETQGKEGLEGAVCVLCMSGAATKFRPVSVDRNPAGGMPTIAVLLEAARRTDEGWRLCESERPAGGGGVGGGPALGTAPPAPPSKTRCLVFEFENKRRMEGLHRPLTVVGRDESCEISLPALSVSRRHAEIRANGPILDLRDLGSRNGTFVNGAKIAGARIDPGDEIVFGDVRAFVVVAEEFEAHRQTEPVLRPGHARPGR